MRASREWLPELMLAAVAVLAFLGMSYVANVAGRSHAELEVRERALRTLGASDPAAALERAEKELAELRSTPATSPFQSRTEVERRITGLEGIIRSDQVRLVSIAQDERSVTVKNEDIGLEGAVPAPRKYEGAELGLEAEGQAGALVDMARSIMDQFQAEEVEALSLAEVAKAAPGTMRLALVLVLYYRPEPAAGPGA